MEEERGSEKRKESGRSAHRGLEVNKEEDAGFTSSGDKNNLRVRKRPNVCLSCRPRSVCVLVCECVSGPSGGV